jgi:hypothetical protein
VTRANLDKFQFTHTDLTSFSAFILLAIVKFSSITDINCEIRELVIECPQPFFGMMLIRFDGEDREADTARMIMMWDIREQGESGSRVNGAEQLIHTYDL